MPPATRETTEISTQDLWEGAALMVKGCNLKDLTVFDSAGKKVATFVLAGEKIELARAEYQSGRASCNVAMLKATMTRLKDMLFQRVRELERSKERKCSGYQR